MNINKLALFAQAHSPRIKHQGAHLPSEFLFGLVATTTTPAFMAGFAATNTSNIANEHHDLLGFWVKPLNMVKVFCNCKIILSPQRIGIGSLRPMAVRRCLKRPAKRLMKYVMIHLIFAMVS